MLVHHRLPDRDWHPVGGLPVPGDLLDLQTFIRPQIKNCPLNKEQRDLAAFERVEIFRRRDIEIVGARHWQDRFHLAGELPHVRAGVCPEARPQSLAPAIGRAEKLSQFFLLRRDVGSLGGLELDLRLQEDALNCLALRRVRDFEFEMKQRRDAKVRGFDPANLEFEISGRMTNDELRMTKE
jgi:hypothetical protein